MPGTAERPYLDRTHPQIYAAMVTVAGLCGDAARAAGLDRGLVELVEARASQINGCVTCLSIHLPAARAAGVDELRLDLLPAWREAACYSPLERAALALTEALTLPGRHDLADAQREAAQVMGTEAVSALEWVVTVINAFNRVSIASGHPPRRPRAVAAPAVSG